MTVKNSLNIQRIPSDSFNWQRWRQCDVLSMFNCCCREYNLINSRKTLRKYAIGYHKSWRLACRPKLNCMAVMFLKDNKYSWFHLTTKEFLLIFNCKKWED